jgi:hypothetical protein
VAYYDMGAFRSRAAAFAKLARSCPRVCEVLCRSGETVSLFPLDWTGAGWWTLTLQPGTLLEGHVKGSPKYGGEERKGPWQLGG